MSLKVCALTSWKLILRQAIEDCSVSKINNYARSCKRCYAIGFYAMCYSVINPCGYWTPSTLGILVNNGR